MNPSSAAGAGAGAGAGPAASLTAAGPPANQAAFGSAGTRARGRDLSLSPGRDGGVDGSTMKRAQPQPEPGRLCLVAWLAATEQLAGPGEGV